MKQIQIVIYFVFIYSLVNAQELVYFNYIYQKQNNFAIGMTILETDNGYIGYGGTEDPENIGQMLLLFKISKQGEEIIWKPFGENYHSYYMGNVGGAMIKTSDDNFALAYHADYNGIAYSSFIKLSNNLDTIWKKNYSTDNLWTMTMNCNNTNDNGFILVGSVKPEAGELWDILLIKTDSLGNMQWYNTYGSLLQEQGANVIQTSEGGYLIGGFKWNPAIYHTLDAMVIKTDSLGNEQWTHYYGNPGVDDDMALLAMADDGNYLVATVYGEWIVSPSTRTGRIYLIKVNSDGETIWEKKIGPKMYHCINKNLRKTNDGNLVSTGFYYQDTISEFILDGWLYKFSQEGDSIWMRDYYYYNNQYDVNIFYDATPTSDNGYIAIGKARPDVGGTNNKMWIVKVDSMGCDTPGCATGVQVFELPVANRSEFKVWPNPTSNRFTVHSSQFTVHEEIIIRVYNSQGIKVEEIDIPEMKETITINVQSWSKGIYFVQLVVDGEAVGSRKIIKN